ncbi:MAG: PqqD family protein [Candidatus Thiodiazotropha endolucinida]|uniref:PqqD family protein n=1 Tax=Candidatus Thiodiazotropha taylori TaxID=2792791 RepID=A0A9E4TT58_9GAMM|nr:PqqD family protein [Candidatus Thiodiazotropha taylori]MCW4236548.1 PqqD family protein [Candidatus Thiodiazotropha endolucinida]
MSSHYTRVLQTEGVRCRNEDGGRHLLYHSQTDQLHMVDGIGKAIYDLCVDDSIDDVVHHGGKLLAESNGADERQARTEVLTFLCELQRRSLVEFL